MIPLLGSNAYAPLTYFFFALIVGAFLFEAWALGDAVMRPAGAYTYAGKRNKQFWLLLVGAAFVVGVFGFVYGPAFLASAGALGSTLFIAAFVVAAVYMADVRPKVKEYRPSKRGTHMGPYGPW